LIRFILLKATFITCPEELLITDFSNLNWNNLGFYQSDDGSLANYTKVSNGAIFTYKAGSYWYTNTVDVTVKRCLHGEGLVLRVIGTGLVSKAAEVSIVIQPGNQKCDGHDAEVFSTIADIKVDPLTGRDIADIDLSTITVVYDPTRIWTFLLYLKPLDVPFLLHSLSLVRAPKVTIMDFSAMDLTKNAFGLLAGTTGSVNKYQSNGEGPGVILNLADNAEWFTMLKDSTGQCYKANTRYLRITGKNLLKSGVSIRLSVRYSTTAQCSGSYLESFIKLSDWTQDYRTGYDYSDIRIAALDGVNPFKLHSIALSTDPTNVDVNLISLELTPSQRTKYQSLITDFTNLNQNSLGLAQVGINGT
jgi:hypothetical protein